MPREFDLYIDGVCLPRSFLADADTQLGVRNDFVFVGRVQRHHDDEDPFAPGVPAGDVFDPGLPGFAVLCRLLSFRLRRSRHQEVAVKLGARGEVLRWRELGDPTFHEFQDGWWEFTWDTPYELYAAELGRQTQMTVEVRRRPPLRDMRSLLNRGGRARRYRHRGAGEADTDAENVGHFND